MNLSWLVGEPGARRVSPFLLLLVILTFFLAFTGVSCNAATTKSEIASIDASQGLSGAQAAQVSECLDALNGVNILTYSGWQLTLGKNPVIGSVPAACNQNNAAGADTSSANIGPQLLALFALVSIGFALLFSSAGLLGLLAARSRAFVTAVFAAGAGALLILDQFHVRDVLLAKISSSSGIERSGARPRRALQREHWHRALGRARDPRSGRRVQRRGARRRPRPGCGCRSRTAPTAAPGTAPVGAAQLVPPRNWMP